jgi:hypothetical protein
MRHYAEMNGSIVVNVIVAADDWTPTEGVIEYTPENPAYIGGDYVEGYFYPPQPFPSWTRSQGTWQPPTPMPTPGLWMWDEATLSWIDATVI